MNTLSHMAACVALLWFSLYAFDTLGQNALGVAVLAGFLVFVALTILAARDDWDILNGGDRN